LNTDLFNHGNTEFTEKIENKKMKILFREFSAFRASVI
jgi:hypothetical protein